LLGRDYFPSLTTDQWTMVLYIAVRGRMFLAMQDYDLSKFNQICPNRITFVQISPQICPNFTLFCLNFAQI